MKFFLSFLLFFIIGFFGTYIYSKTFNKSSQVATGNIFQNKRGNFNLFLLINPPAQSLPGNILSLTGQVNWQSRIATTSSPLVKKVNIVQGEKITTGDNSALSVGFGSGILINMSGGSDLSFIQTLPDNFVVGQDSGEIEYTNTKNTSLAVRTGVLLVQFGSGQISVAVNKKTGFVTIIVNKGQAEAAYNDLHYVSQLLAIKEKQSLIFDPVTRTVRIQPPND